MLRPKDVVRLVVGAGAVLPAVLGVISWGGNAGAAEPGPQVAAVLEPVPVERAREEEGGPPPLLANFTPVDLRAAVNMGFKDSVSGDGKGGWTDQGSNDMRFIPTGRQNFRGVQFDIIDPGKNDGRSAIVLFSTVRPYFPEQVEAKGISAKARSIYFLHGAGWSSKTHCATYTVRYADGTEVAIPIRGGLEVDNWWGSADGDRYVVGWSGANLASGQIGLVMFAWQNPNPDKAIESIRFASQKGKAVTCIVAVSLSDADAKLPAADKAEEDEDLEFQPGRAATIGMKKVVGEVRPEDLLPPVELAVEGELPEPGKTVGYKAAEDWMFSSTTMHNQEKLPIGGVADVSFLNEKPAGGHGFLRLNAEGRLTFEDGTPARFLCINNTYDIMFPRTMEEARQRAQWVAANGINLIRIHHFAHSGKDNHGSVIDFWEGTPEEVQAQVGRTNRRYRNTRRLDPIGLDRMDMYMAALKEQGVYVHISALVFPWIGDIEAVENDIPPRGSGYHGYRTEGAQYFIEEYIRKNRQYLRDLLTHKNPHTGLRWVDDPMFASIECFNEDSMFWRGCDPNRLSGYYFMELHELWNNWLLDRYGSAEKLRSTWGADALDDWETPTRDVNFMKVGREVPVPPMFAQAPKGYRPMGLSPAVNTAHTDRYGSDAEGGWFDLGKDYDMRFFARGKRLLLGIPFDICERGPVLIADTASFPGLGRNKDRPNPRAENDWPKSVTLPVTGRARTVYFLHTAGWMPGGGKPFMHYDVEYADGTNETVGVRKGREIGDWSDPVNGENLRIAWSGMSLAERNIGATVYAWENPHPQKDIARIVARTEGSEAIACILGVTLSDDAPALPDLADMPLMPEWKKFVRLMGYTRFTREGWTPSLLRRGSDQIRFLYDVQTGYWRKQEKWLKEDLGWKSLVLGSPWKTPPLMEFADRYSNARLDILDMHNYGGSNGFMRAPGTGTMTSGPVRVFGKPLMISEYYPRREEEYRLCVFPLLSLYGQGLNGWEFPMQFSCRRLGWGFYEHWDHGLNYPMDLTQYPAMALAVRRGDIREGPVVYKRMISQQEVFAENMAATNVEHPYELAYFAVGKVGTEYCDRLQPDLCARELIEGCWDKEKGVVRSATGELVWDYEKGIATCRADRTQGAVGFLNRLDPIELPAADVSTPNPFAAIWLSSLNDKPIASSDKVLITLVGRNGTDPKAKERGSATYLPVVIEQVSGRVTLKSELADRLKVYAVGYDGRPVRRLSAQAADGAVTFRFDTLVDKGPYVLVTTEDMPVPAAP